MQYINKIIGCIEGLKFWVVVIVILQFFICSNIGNISDNADTIKFYLEQQHKAQIRGEK